MIQVHDDAKKGKKIVEGNEIIREVRDIQKKRKQSDFGPALSFAHANVYKFECA